MKAISLKEITSVLIGQADTFSFIIRKGTKFSDRTIALMEKLKMYFIEKKEVSQWPGTKLFWDQANIYTYYLNDETAYILYSEEDYLFNWLLPELPEDLVAYKNGVPFFISITHESEAYFEGKNDDQSL